MSSIDFLRDLDSSQVLNASFADGRWRAETDDPQIIFKPERALSQGWYRLTLDLGSEGSPLPRLYFDFGHGFSEVYATDFVRVEGTTLYSQTLKLPFPVRLLRLDPINTKGTFAVDKFCADKLGVTEVGVEIVRSGLEVLRADPRGFLRRLPRYLGALNKPYFLWLSDPKRATRSVSASYARWIRHHDFSLERDGAKVRAEVAALASRPKISVVMPAYNTPASLLRAAIESVRSQIYDNWELCIADDFSTKAHVRRILASYAQQDPRIKVTFRRTNGHISLATNSAFALATGDWIALLDHDDLLRPHALAEVAFEIARHPDAQMIYSDEDKIDSLGNRFDPYFKPDFSRELFRSQNYLNHLSVHRAENIRAVGGWRQGFEGSQDYDLNLRIFERIDRTSIRHISKVLYHWRAVKGSTASSGAEKSYAYVAGMRALEEHVSRTNLAATVERARDTPFYRLRLSVPQPPPLVSLIIPTRDKVDLLRGCIRSILEKTSYRPYEIIVVDNGSVEPATLRYFEEISTLENVRVLKYDKPFNYSAINNFAVAQAKGIIVGLVNNDIEVISDDWLGEMVSWAMLPDVGCVGAMLYYGNNTIQHAGVILGIGGVANHAHLGQQRTSLGYFGRAAVVGNFSAVTGACLLIRKSVYEDVGGLDEQNLPVAFNDVDFSLKVRDAGYLNVWTPYAELYHLESASRGADIDDEKRARFEREGTHMLSRWKDALNNDPYHSPNLSKEHTDFSLKA